MLTLVPLTACDGGGEDAPAKYTVMYSVNDAEGGSVTCATQDGIAVSSGDELEENTVVVFTATENAGYAFDGYFSGTENKCSEKEYTVTLTSNVEFTAKFSIQSYALNYSATTGGTVTSAVESGDAVVYKTSVTLTATESTGYDFVGWYIGNERISTDAEYTFNMPANAVTVEARFVPEEYDLTYFVNNSAMGEIECAIENGADVAFGTSVTISAIEYTGYNFIGWYVANEPINSNPNYTFTMEVGNLELEARFIPEKHVLVYQVNNSVMGEIDCEETSGDDVDYGTEITLTASVNSGYAFVGWFVSGEEKSTELEYTFDMPENSIVVEAVFEKAKFEFNYSVNDSVMGEIDCAIESGSQVEYQTSITLTATENTGYDFVGWYVLGEEKGTDTEYTFDMPASEVTVEARFKAEKRSVTFYDSYDRLKTDNVDYNSKISFEPTKLNYNFAGWYTDSGLSVKFNTNSTVTENMSLYAKWTAVPVNERMHEVLFVDDEGNQIGGTQLIKHNSKITLRPADPTKEGYEFDYWTYYDALNDRYAEVKFTSFYVKEDTTIIAKFTINKYDVKLYTYASSYTTQKVEHGAKLAKPKTPTNSDATKIFDKWVYKEDTATEFDFNTPITQNLELQVIWKTVYTTTYTVKFYDEGSSTALDTQKVESGKSASLPASPTKVGYTFTGWDVAEEDGDYTNVTRDLNVYATYTLNKYTVKYINYDGEELTSQEINHDNSATEPTLELAQKLTRTGYTFMGWAINSEDGELYDFNTLVKGDLELYAKFEINTFTVTFYDEDTLLETQSGIEYGGFATIPQTPTKAGNSFAGWYLDQEFTTEFEFGTPVTSSFPVYVKFVPIETEKFKVEFKDADGTLISEQKVLIGNSAIVPADPTKVGYTFAGWEVAEEDGDYTNVTMPLTITATYNKKQFTVKFFEADGVTQIGNDLKVYYEEYVQNTDIPTPTVTIENMHHAGWDKEVSTTKITKDTNFIAKYAPDICTVTFAGAGETFTQTVEKGFYANIPNTPIKTNYIFEYWYLEGSEETAFDFSTQVITEDIELYAKFIQTACTVSFIGADNEPYGNVQIVKVGYKATEPAPYDDGTLTDYIWCLQGENVAFDFENTPITSDIVLYAKTTNTSN